MSLAAREDVVYDSSRRPHPFVEEAIELYRYRDLVRLWSIRNITLRYKRSVLGVLWTLIEPLMLMVILSVVFSTIFRFAIVNYPIYILSGLITFDFFNRSTQQIVDEIITSQNLSQRIYLPRSALAFASIIGNLTNWLLALLPLTAIMLVLQHPFSWALISVPLAMLLTSIFALGVGLLVATLGAFFHDIKLIYVVLLSAWFYATPIIYPLEIVPEQFVTLFQLNPLFHLVTLFRTPVFSGEIAPASAWLAGCSLSLGAGALGWWVFTHWSSAFDYRV